MNPSLASLAVHSFKHRTLFAASQFTLCKPALHFACSHIFKMFIHISWLRAKSRQVTGVCTRSKIVTQVFEGYSCLGGYPNNMTSVTVQICFEVIQHFAMHINITPYILSMHLTIYCSLFGIHSAVCHMFNVSYQILLIQVTISESIPYIVCKHYK